MTKILHSDDFLELLSIKHNLEFTPYEPIPSPTPAAVSDETSAIDARHSGIATITTISADFESDDYTPIKATKEDSEIISPIETNAFATTVNAPVPLPAVSLLDDGELVDISLDSSTPEPSKPIRDRLHERLAMLEASLSDALKAQDMDGYESLQGEITDLTNQIAAL